MENVEAFGQGFVNDGRNAASGAPAEQVEPLAQEGSLARLTFKANLDGKLIPSGAEGEIPQRCLC